MAMSEWSPLSCFHYGRVVESFLPLKLLDKKDPKHKAIAQNFVDVHPGDQVYLFEQEDGGKWVRGYVVSLPMPSDFLTAGATLDRMPENRVSVALLPRSCVQVVKEIPYNKSYVLSSDSLPPLPPESQALTDSFLDEVVFSLRSLAVYIFAVYSMNQFSLFQKLKDIYSELDDIRLQFLHDLLTKDQKVLAQKQAAALVNRISKLLAPVISNDVGGYLAISSRDEKTGQLFRANKNPENMINLAKVAQNQVFSALASNFPVSNADVSFVPEKCPKLQPALPCHILVDFKSVSGSSNIVPNGYDGITAYMYLRNTRKTITEAFSITIRPHESFDLENISAALFKNIPASEVENTRVYLVAVLTENIRLPENTLPSIRKGIGAGVANITRIFSGRQGHLTAGQAHQFTIKLFSSYTSRNSQQPSVKPGMSPVSAVSSLMENNGWGELVDRIIAGSSKGVAINPRAEQITLSIKELKNNNLLDSIDAKTSAIASIRPSLYSPLEPDYSRSYLTVNKCNLVAGLDKEKCFVTVEVKSPTQGLRFAKGTNEDPRKVWQFLTVSPDEYVGETVHIFNIDENSIIENEYLLFTVYLNGNSLGEGRYHLRSGHQIRETKKGAQVEIYGDGSSQVAAVDFDLQYVGKKYNADPAVATILNWKKFYSANLEGNYGTLIQVLATAGKVELATAVKFFPELLHTFLEIFNESRVKKLLSLEIAAFESVVRLLDVTIARQDHYNYVFSDFLEKYKNLPTVGEQLLHLMASYFSQVDTDWNSTGRALCRTSHLVLKLAAACYANSTAFAGVGTFFSNSAAKLLAIKQDSILADQLLIAESLELWLDVLREFHDDAHLLKMAAKWIDAIGLQGLGAADDVPSKKKSHEHRLIVSKLIFIRRLLNSWLIHTSSVETRDTLMASALKWALQVVLSEQVDIYAIRLALGIILAFDTACFGEDRLFHDDSKQAYVTIARLLPVLGETFNRCLVHCQKNGYFKPRRTFTQLFPVAYPFPEHTIDSAVNNESFCEVLIELAVLIAIHAKIGRANGDAMSQYLAKKTTSSAYETLNGLLGAPGSVLDSPTKPFDTVRWVVSTISARYYPADKWLSLRALITEGILSLTEFVYPMAVRILPPPGELDRFNVSVWHKYLVAIMRCATAKTSSLEHLHDIPRKCCYQLEGDIRPRAAGLVQSVWNSLGARCAEKTAQRFKIEKCGGFQTLFIADEKYTVVGDVLLLCFQRNTTCVDVGTKLLWSMMVDEWLNKQSLEDLQRLCIVSIYEIFHTENSYSPGPEEIVGFISHLADSVKLDPEDEAHGPVMGLIDKLSGYLENMNELQKIPKGSEFDDDRMYYKLKLSQYLANVDRPEVFQSFVNDLYQSNLERGHYVQAALSLGLLADTYSWDPETEVPACERPSFPKQTAFQRKEQLYKMIASNFVRGKRLEQAVDVYQELLRAYMSYNFDLRGLSYCHGELAKIYKALETVDRVESSYFRIEFVGAGFPDALRNKQYIYEGLAFEHITSMIQRLLRLYPGAHLINSEEELQKLKDSEPAGKHLHVKSVAPYKDMSGDKLSLRTKQYVDNKDLRQFQATRRLTGSTGIQDLWTEEVTYETYAPFPTLMNRSEIKTTTVTKLSPVENALRSLSARNESLEDLEQTLLQAMKKTEDYSQLSKSAIFGELSRVLAGTVDSPVNGGAGQYRVFFAKTDKDGTEQAVEAKFEQLVQNLYRLLRVHALLVPDSLLESHKGLVELFGANFAPEIESLHLSVGELMDVDKIRETPQNVSFEPAGSLHLTMTNTSSNASVHSNSSEPRFSQSLASPGVRLYTKAMV
ncbi:hypothetical protein KL905_001608 [Ogataea polymorpha]|nr:hypothetical protein KL905_001608 [Ogataea polymorpha]